MNQVPLIYSDFFLRHDTGYGHPEKAQRLISVVEALKTVPWSDSLTWIEPSPCAIRDPIPWIYRVHSPQYLDSVESLSTRGGGTIDADTTVSPDSYDVALLAVNAWLDGIELVRNSQSPAFVAARPPGHHALPDYGMGFCIFNNVAIAAHYALAQPEIERVAILDWDIHHGNGTQAIAESHSQIFYCSLHQSPCYPGTGLASEQGQFNNILNVPMSPHSNIGNYCQAMNDQVMPFLQDAKPDLLLISAGYDATIKDPLAQMCLNPEDYQVLMKTCLTLTSTVLLGLEGGYHCESLAQSVVSTLLPCVML